eukprot:CAMPEP_0184495694 /NCGR_PEP_ID=MMETSP0113_2-20130426/32089_1 /TAXON_ID=91329 /ORGANISM="Norrisiella sphaerica, Strain BC52" /LENGTH=126 /DNA_ID=CAMNT_0026881997 /DNA_START=32 /DNA_END=409 /DNA_ORIENTATION=+
MDLLEEQAEQDVRMTYRAVGSSTGQTEFAGETNNNVALTHFGSGDIPLTQERYDAITGAGRTVLHVPFAVGSISIFHNVPEADLGGSPLQLDACTLGEIFQGTITTWDDAKIKALNPNLNVPTNEP